MQATVRKSIWFLTKKIYIQAVTYFKIEILEALLSHENALVISIDLSNTFDTICHTSLLYKLQKYGIRGGTLQWVKSYLSDRK